MPEMSKDFAQATSINIVQLNEFPKPYTIPVKITIENTNSESHKYVSDAVIDSGWRISLVRSDVIPREVRLLKKEHVSQFFGLNGSQLKIDGMFYSILETNDMHIRMKFYIVSSSTIAYIYFPRKRFFKLPTITSYIRRNFQNYQ